MKSLKNKKILITAGPTWVAIDKVRIISNVASGQTGILLANTAKRMGAQVTLALGPVGNVSLPKGIRVLRFNFFAELFAIIRKELAGKDYAVVIHSAAVSDYRPKITFRHKLASGIKNLDLELSPTFRIVDRIKRLNQRALLVAFKLEFGLNQDKLVAESVRLAKRAQADLVAANTFTADAYRAYVIDYSGKVLAKVNSKPKLSLRLLQIIKERL